jgi:hypothetical protein
VERNRLVRAEDDEVENLGLEEDHTNPEARHKVLVDSLEILVLLVHLAHPVPLVPLETLLGQGPDCALVGMEETARTVGFGQMVVAGWDGRVCLRLAGE